MDAERTWEAALGQLQLELPRATFDTWVRDAELLTYEDGTFILGVQNAYARDWLDQRLRGVFGETLSRLAGRTVEVRFVLWPGEAAEESAPARGRTDAHAAAGRRPTSTPVTLSRSFVVGASNRLAHAASLAVAENPARAYNPLFLYGGVGLGKTHLLHAVGQWRASTPGCGCCTFPRKSSPTT